MIDSNLLPFQEQYIFLHLLAEAYIEKQLF